jgi:predicted nucleic acid-binding protein
VKVLFDTSVLVPALTPALPCHAAAYRWLSAAVSGRIEGIMSWHAFAEAWSVLTRLPIKPALAPAAVQESLASLENVIERRALDGRAYLAASRRCAERGLRSGAIFDALHLICAERARADAIVTENVQYFERLREEASPRIISCEDPVGRAR